MLFLVTLLAACSPDKPEPRCEDGFVRGADGNCYERHADPPDTDTAPDDTAPLDADGDGYSPEAGDCDDGDADVNPGQVEGASSEEPCNGLDDDCDGHVDENIASTWYVDADGDGFGDPGVPVSACELVAGLSDNDIDCDDADAAVHPGAPDVCEDALDADCDGGDPACGIVLADADGLYTGEDTGGYAGYSVGTGDVDADGDEEAIIGAHASGLFGRGTAYVADGLPAGAESLAGASAKLAGATDRDAAGFAVGAGDVDGDGDDDVLVTAYGADAPCGVTGIPDCDGAGRAYVVASPPSSASLADATWEFVGYTPLSGDRSGGSPVLAGRLGLLSDVTGDGLADTLVVAYGNQYRDEGIVVRVVPAPFAAETALEDASALVSPGGYVTDVGKNALAAGDVTGDGVGDVVFGSMVQRAYAGAVFIQSGPFVGVADLADATATISGDRADDRFGSAVELLDYDGDGYLDLAAASPSATGGGFDAAGVVYLVAGPLAGSVRATTAALELTGEGAGDGIGDDLAVGDFDGDGAPTLVIAARSAGATYLVSGGRTGTVSAAEADVKFVHDVAIFAGWSVAAGDLDGDGRDDLMIGAFADSTAGTEAGAAYVFDGSGF